MSENRLAGRRRIPMVALVILVLLVVSSTLVASAATGYTLQNRNTARCMDLKDWSTTNGAWIAQWSCDGGSNQRWSFVSASGGYYQIRNVHSGKCLDLPNGNTANGTKLQQWSCTTNNDNQLWKLIDIDPGNSVRYVIYPKRHLGKCIDVSPASGDGVRLQIWDCHQGTNQQWLRQQP